MIVDERTSLLFVPGISGAPWNLRQMKFLSRRPLRTMRLPNGWDSLETYADHVHRMIAGLKRYVIVGDGFGALVAVVFASRRPRRLAGMVVSGGFPTKAAADQLLNARPSSQRIIPTLGYKNVTLRHYAEAIASDYDDRAEVPWSIEKTQALLEDHTPPRSYTARLRAISAAEYADRLPLIKVPALILIPSDHGPFGKSGAAAMIRSIPRAEGVLIKNSGVNFRYSHPHLYSRIIERFLLNHVDPKDKVDPLHRQEMDPLDEETTQVVATMPDGGSS